MVARINTGKSIAKAPNYNEQKVQTGMAEKLIASSFVKDLERLNFMKRWSSLKGIFRLTNNLEQS